MISAHRPVTGETRLGTPLSFNRAPAPDLEPWVGRAMVAITEAAPVTSAGGYLCNDAAYLRTAMDASWDVETADGLVSIIDRTFLSGQHRHAMRLDFRGPIRVAGLMLRPGAMRSIWGIGDASMAQRVVPMAGLGLDEQQPTALYRPGIDAAEWLDALEGWLRQEISRVQAQPPDPVSLAFELAAFADPSRPVGEVAEELGVKLRTLQRLVGRDFGIAPKAVMRRARILDLASRICGVADEEECDIELRFFDQSHRIREFQDFFGVTSPVFRAQRDVLITLSLEIRQARRLELLDRLKPGAVRPWMRQSLAQQAARSP